jgi:glycosyltransferase involved in cell wall biosynthesis
MKVALVYDRLNKWGGAERVLLALHEIFPKASLYTSIYSPRKARWAKVFPKIIPSFLQKIPFFQDKHELLAPLMPIAFETLDLGDLDLVISVTSEAAKGVITRPPARHICYCLTPTRYLWSGYDIYFQNPTLKAVSRPVVSYLRYWDKMAAQKPDVMVAISTVVKKRIKKYYHRNSEIIFPPVDINKFKIQNSKVKTTTKKAKFYLLVSRLVVYKRIDLAIEVFNELGLPLVIVGSGSEEKRLKRIARSNIKFTGYLTDEKLADYYKGCQALIFPQEEDFGLVVVEAQSAGIPVIAYKKGGALDTVINGKTGIFFSEQKKESLIKAIKRFERLRFNKKVIMKNAERFSKERFKKEFLELIKKHT